MKICTKCKIEKPKTEYRKDSKSKDGISHSCKQCRDAYNAAYRAANAESIAIKCREYQDRNRESIAAQKRKYNAENAAEIAEQTRAYRDKNRSEIAAQKSAHYSKNKESISLRLKKYYESNREMFSAHGRARKARKKNAEGRHSASEVVVIFEKQRGLCANCKAALLMSGKQKYHVDHIMPLAKGGSNWPSNLQCLCPTCNLKKNAKDPVKWANENGRLI